MKLNATRVYSFIFIVVLLLQLYLSSFKLNVFIQLFVLFVFFFFEGYTVSKSFIKIILPVILMFILGFSGTLINKYALFNIVKDIFHSIKPLLGLSIGFLFYKKINNLKIFIKTIVVVGFMSAIIHFFILFFLSGTDSVASIREFGKDNFLELFALFFLFFYKKFNYDRLFENRKMHTVFFITIVFSVIAYLSRTMIVVAVLLLLSIYGYSIITLKTVKFFSFFGLAVLLFYTYLFSIKLDRESFLYKIKNAPAEIFQTKIDRENHADLWDHWRAYEAKRAFALMQENTSSFVFGCGYGSLINLKFYAPLSDDKKGLKYISELHNGFMYLLYKTGIIGIIIYFYFLRILYKKIYQNQHFTTVFVSAIGLMFIFTTITITGIYNTKDTIVFILGGLLFYNNTFNIKTSEE